MTKYVGCIDLHDGKVKQIVGATLSNDDNDNNDNDKNNQLSTNYVSSHSPKYYAELYRDNKIYGTHVIKLGPNNDNAADEAIKAWPNALQIGGGINLDNCQEWIDKGADKVIITSWLFPNGELSWDRLKLISDKIGKEHLVVDVSCKKDKEEENVWIVAMNKWQTLTNTKLSKELFNKLGEYCNEILVHAADVEGLCKGIDEELVIKLGEWCCDMKDIKIVYAGGAKSLEDLRLVDKLSNGKVDLTYGSSLDLFGGNVKFTDLVKYNNDNNNL